MLQGHNNALTHSIILGIGRLYHNLALLATLAADALSMAPGASTLGINRNDNPTLFDALNDALMLQRGVHR